MDYDGEIFELSNKEQEFEYRSSVFNKKDYIILETKLRLEYGKKEEIKKKMDEYYLLLSMSIAYVGYICITGDYAYTMYWSFFYSLMYLDMYYKLR